MNLTLGIPTWNRFPYLKNNVLDMIAQIEFFHLTSVEILISDNASDDGTEQWCRELSQKYSFIKYHRQPSNLGANINLETVLRLGRGDYIWILGDDDLLAKNILLDVINDIQKYKPDLIIGPASDSETFQKATHQCITEITYTDRNFFQHHSLIEIAGKISGIIFKKACVLPILEQAQDIITESKTPWPHLIWVILLLNDLQKKMLLLPYGTNLLVSENWHNLLFNGVKLIQIHFVAQQDMLVGLRSYLVPSFYHALVNQIAANRVGISLKCVVYATYLDSYAAPLKSAWKFFPKLLGWRNKLSYFVFLLVPLTIPVFLRKVLLNVAAALPLSQFKKLQIVTGRLKEARRMVDDDSHNLRQQFDETQL